MRRVYISQRFCITLCVGITFRNIYYIMRFNTRRPLPLVGFKFGSWDPFRGLINLINYHAKGFSDNIITTPMLRNKCNNFVEIFTQRHSIQISSLLGAPFFPFFTNKGRIRYHVVNSLTLSLASRKNSLRPSGLHIIFHASRDKNVING